MTSKQQQPLSAPAPTATPRLTSAIRRGSSSTAGGVTFAAQPQVLTPTDTRTRPQSPKLAPLAVHHELEEQQSQARNHAVAASDHPSGGSTLDSAATALKQWQEQALESVAQTLFSQHFTKQKLRVHHTSGHNNGDGNGDEGIGPETVENDPFGPISGQRRLISSVPLQLLLVFNSALFPVWFGIMVAVTNAKFAEWAARNTIVNEFYSFTLHFTLITFTVCEPARLILGWRGNKDEKIPNLAGFLLLTVLPQLLILLYFPFIQRTHNGSQVDALEVSINVIYTLVVVPQLPLAYGVADRVFHALCIPIARA